MAQQKFFAMVQYMKADATCHRSKGQSKTVAPKDTELSRVVTCRHTLQIVTQDNPRLLHGLHICNAKTVCLNNF